MEVNYQVSPSFNARLISKPQIGMLQTAKGIYEEVDAAFVKIDPNYAPDVEALSDIKYWENDKFGWNIYIALCNIRDGIKSYKSNSVYALTSQMDSFEKLDSDKILGIVHVSPFEKDGLLIENIQTKPDFIYKPQPLYMGIGSGIMDSLKEFCRMIKSHSSKEKSVRNFYIKNNFLESVSNPNDFIWVKN
ncbi:hypothetical protein IJ541_04600 [bacterium]|nr:hypothetical protein [bacterium]